MFSERDIPEHVPMPLGNYKAVVLRGDIGFVSGQFPIRNGKLLYKGRVGADLSIEDGRQAAAVCALNVLGHLRLALGDEYQRVSLARIDGYIASAPDCFAQPAVLDGASDTFVSILGERGNHARAVFAVSHLPQDAPIELLAIFHLQSHV